MDFSRGCPGSDRSSWTPNDIFEVACERCGAAVEFFKDDARRRCPSCGATLANPKREPGCADWCAAAEKCSLGREVLGAGRDEDGTSGARPDDDWTGGARLHDDGTGGPDDPADAAGAAGERRG